MWLDATSFCSDQSGPGLSFIQSVFLCQHRPLAWVWYNKNKTICSSVYRNKEIPCNYCACEQPFFFSPLLELERFSKCLHPLLFYFAVWLLPPSLSVRAESCACEVSAIPCKPQYDTKGWIHVLKCSREEAAHYSRPLHQQGPRARAGLAALLSADRWKWAEEGQRSERARGRERVAEREMDGRGKARKKRGDGKGEEKGRQTVLINSRIENDTLLTMQPARAGSLTICTSAKQLDTSDRFAANGRDSTDY